MPREIRTAIAATASDQLRKQLAHALSMAGISLIGAACSGADALEMQAGMRADLLAADAQLPMMDGCALARRILGSFSLPVRPAVMILHWREFPPPDSCVPVGAVLAEKPIDPSAFCAAVESLRKSAVFSPAEEERANALLSALGVPDHIGRSCLRQAALMCAADEGCLHNLSARVYPRLARMHALTAAQAERAMRHAIGLAWQSDQFDNQYRIFADTVDAGRGQPTCSEMISRLADILRLEG